MNATCCPLIGRALGRLAAVGCIGLALGGVVHSGAAGPDKPRRLGLCPGAQCPPGPVIQENEPDCGLPVDTVNGGCGTLPARFIDIAVGDTVCGTCGFDSDTFQYDADWFRITLAVPMRITWSVTGEAGMTAAVRGTVNGSGSCNPNQQGFRAESSLPCEPAVVADVELCAGIHYLEVWPDLDNPPECGSRYVARLTGVPVPLPGNDTCATAQPVTSFPALLAGDTMLATLDPGAPLCDGPALGAGVWYTVTGTGTTLSANVCFYFDVGDIIPQIRVYRGSCGGLECVQTTAPASSCSYEFVLFPQVQWCAEPGVRYFILVANYAGGSPGRFPLNIIDLGPSGCTARGGCCTGAGCSLLTRAACAAAGGTYRGDGSSCLPRVSGTGAAYTSAPQGDLFYGACPLGQVDTIVVPPGGHVGRATVHIAIPDQTDVGALEMTLEHGGAKARLIGGACPGIAGLDVTFDDAAPAIACSSPITGSCRPVDPLAAFGGADAGGAWVLRLCEGQTHARGTLVSWTLTLSPGCSLCDADADHNGRFEPADVAAFIQHWLADLTGGGGAGDFDSDGRTTPADVAAFVNAWFAALQAAC